MKTIIFLFTNQNYVRVFPLLLPTSYLVEMLQQILIISIIFLRTLAQSSEIKLRRKLSNYQMGFLLKDKDIEKYD